MKLLISAALALITSNLALAETQRQKIECTFAVSDTEIKTQIFNICREDCPFIAPSVRTEQIGEIIFYFTDALGKTSIGIKDKTTRATSMSSLSGEWIINQTVLEANLSSEGMPNPFINPNSGPHTSCKRVE